MTYNINHMNSELYDAIIKDDICLLQKLEQKLSIGLQLTPTKNTVLHLACQYGSIKCVQKILQVHESLLLVLNSRQETALHLAARQGHFEVVVLLIHAAKFSLLQPNYLQYTTSTILEILIRAENVELETALHAAVRYNHNNVVEVLVKEDPSQPQGQNVLKETPIYMASIRCYSDIMKTILDNCNLPSFCGPNQRTTLRAMFGGPDGRTALHAAVSTDDGGECVKLLLQKAKNLISVADNYGWTAFHFVAYNGLYQVVEDLVRADKCVGYRPDKRFKRTPLHVAAYEGIVRMMVELLKYYPDSWDIVDGRGRNILHIAVERNNEELISYILSRGFEACNVLLIQRDKEGNTPLHLMAKLGRYIPEIMDPREASCKIDWEVLDYKNQTPLDLTLYIQKTDTLAYTLNSAKILWKLWKAKVRDHGRLWNTQKEPGGPTRDKDQRPFSETVNSLKKLVNSHMIVSALIATVALTAGFTIPGGFNEEKGAPNLLNKAAFKAFMVMDTIAVLASISALLLYFVMTMCSGIRIVKALITASAALNIISIMAMMLTFSTGTYVVLAPSSSLAISVCVLSTFCPLLFIIMFFPFLQMFFFKVIKKLAHPRITAYSFNSIL